jgi:ketosteroid isomerase-like protein
MKRIGLIIIAISLSLSSKTQTPFEQIVGAENNFEKQCFEMGIKKGFLANLDSSAIAFTKEKIENARKFWNSLPDFPGIYSWTPSFAEVSASGDWGYTTGAVEYRDSSINDRPSLYNQYTTVWQKNKQGEWKFLVDIGNTHGAVAIDHSATEVKSKKTPVRNLNRQAIHDLEKSYFSLFKMNSSDAIKKFYSKNFILNFSGNPLTKSIDTAIVLFNPIASYIIYEPVDVRLSPSGDMACVSGYIIQSNKRKHYLRIWRHESTGWKIALEVTKI